MLRDPEPLTRNCSAGCLYDLTRDPSESDDLAVKRPADLARLLAAFDALREGFYDNDDNAINAALCERGRADVPCACKVAVEKYGGFLGPFQDVDF